MSDYKDYYKILGVTKNASDAEIKKAFKAAARKYHPDMHKDADKAAMTEKFKDVNEAYEVLSDKQKRSVYDQVGPDYANYAKGGGAQQQRQSQGFGGNPYSQYYDGSGFSGAGGGFNFNNTGGFEAGDFSDFFQSIFGGMGGGGFGGFSGFGNAGAAQSAGPGADEAGLILSLEDAHRGGRMNLTLPSGKSATVNIPPGIKDGQTLKLKGLGGQSRRGPKDLYLKISLAPHAVFTHNQSDLDADVTIMPWTAALGGPVQVPTLDGYITIKVPPGTQSGKRMKLSGKGLGGKGDLYVKLLIDIPPRLTEKQTALFEKLRDLS
ncbi:MAG: DnaJ domain-containing protein [Elusimicrobia bacterium]|nr:DnaJ domain-containing protein [Elusimicrobiota bacterium]